MRNTIDWMRSITSELNFTSRRAECFLYQGPDMVGKWSEHLNGETDHRKCVANFISEMFSFYTDLASLTIKGITTDEINDVYDYCKQLHLIAESEDYQLILDLRKEPSIIIDRDLNSERDLTTENN
jgi:hypothetical protein